MNRPNEDDPGSSFKTPPTKLRIVFSDDEDVMHHLVELAIRGWCEDFTLIKFLKHEDCWQELLRQDPDLLIMDMIKHNVPGRTNCTDMDGFRLLGLLAARMVKFPILVISGSFSMSGFEGAAKQFAGRDLNVHYLTKPFSKELFHCALEACLGARGTRVNS